MRIGVFGGTFDPVHLGHLVIAEMCREQSRLDRVLFLPAPRPPHKREAQLTSFDQRVEMLALALSGNPAFVIDDLEKDRPGPSYTADTLARLQEKYPGDELLLLLGADSLDDLPYWYEPAQIVQRATLLIAARPGWPVMSADELQVKLKLPAITPLRMQVVETPLIGIASRDLRRRIAEGHSIRYLVPRAIEAYIADKHLYR